MDKNKSQFEFTDVMAYYAKLQIVQLENDKMYYDKVCNSEYNVIKELDIRKPRTVLDLGCGLGRMSVFLNRKWNDKKIKFTASGLKVLEKGWTQIYPSIIEEKPLDDYTGPIDLDKINFPEKETQPPKRYTPTSLITSLEKKNLGTKSTRSIIVDTL